VSTAEVHGLENKYIYTLCRETTVQLQEHCETLHLLSQSVCIAWKMYVYICGDKACQLHMCEDKACQLLMSMAWDDYLLYTYVQRQSVSTAYHTYKVNRYGGSQGGGQSVPFLFSIKLLSRVFLALPLIPVVPSCFTEQGYTTKEVVPRRGVVTTCTSKADSLRH
jgi:hypothetical protein